MIQTLYFALPDVPSAEQIIRDLLIARIEVPRIQCLVRRGVHLGELPESSILQKADVMPVAGIGFTLGGMLGGIVGGLLMLFPPPSTSFHLWMMPLAATVGATLGACVSSTAGMLAPNSRIAAFERSVAHGSILLTVEVPYARALEILNLVQSRHPAAMLAQPQEPDGGTIRS